METMKMDNLAINEHGFIFDPATGCSYNANKTALMIINLIREGKQSAEIETVLLEHFDVGEEVLTRDIDFFFLQLQQYGLFERSADSAYSFKE